RERMPEIQINGKLVRSSAGMLHGILQTQAPQIDLEACYEALAASWREAERLRALDHREVSALDRFAYFFRQLRLDEAALPEGWGRPWSPPSGGARGAPGSPRRTTARCFAGSPSATGSPWSRTSTTRRRRSTSSGARVSWSSSTPSSCRARADGASLPPRSLQR